MIINAIGWLFLAVLILFYYLSYKKISDNCKAILNNYYELNLKIREICKHDGHLEFTTENEVLYKKCSICGDIVKYYGLDKVRWLQDQLEYYLKQGHEITIGDGKGDTQEESQKYNR